MTFHGAQGAFPHEEAPHRARGPATLHWRCLASSRAPRAGRSPLQKLCPAARRSSKSWTETTTGPSPRSQAAYEPHAAPRTPLTHKDCPKGTKAKWLGSKTEQIATCARTRVLNSTETPESELLAAISSPFRWRKRKKNMIALVHA